MFPASLPRPHLPPRFRLAIALSAASVFCLFIIYSLPSKPVPRPPAAAQGSVLLLLPKDTNRDADYGFDDWHEKTIANRREYALFHGFSFDWIDISAYKSTVAAQSKDKSPRHSLQWAKIFALHDAFDRHPEAEWIWCLDSDVIIMNATLNVWDHVLSPTALERNVIPAAKIRFGGRKKNKPSHDATVYTPKVVDANDVFLVIAADESGLNAGSFFVKRNSFMSAFVDLWHEPYLMDNTFSFNEQDGLTHLIINHPHVLKHVGVVPSRLINTNRNEYRDGDLLVHFAGCRDSRKDAKECDKKFVEFWNRRTVVERVVEPV